MYRYLFFLPAYYLAKTGYKSFSSNYLQTRVKAPAIGSIVYCGLVGHLAVHSGIYVGNNMIVHLNGDGLVEKVDGFQFVRRLGGKNPSRSIYVSCKEGKAIGSPEAAQRAIDKVGSKIKYDLIENNCHDFVARCFIDDSSGMVYGRLCLTYSALSSQSLITTIANRLLEADNWKVWGVS